MKKYYLVDPEYWLRPKENNNMTQQNLNWLEEENQKLAKQVEYEETPSLKMIPNVIADIEIDFSNPFKEWVSENQGKKITKKIIPVTLQGQKLVWWLNVKNPVYKEIIQAGKSGQTKFKILQTGTQQNTKYVLVK